MKIKCYFLGCDINWETEIDTAIQLETINNETETVKTISRACLRCGEVSAWSIYRNKIHQSPLYKINHEC